jgi:hypothetical protein
MEVKLGQDFLELDDHFCRSLDAIVAIRFWSGELARAWTIIPVVCERPLSRWSGLLSPTPTERSC